MLSEKIKLLSVEESELLKADKLTKNHQNLTGLYLLCGEKRYTAFDYSERQSWLEMFEMSENAPKGWVKDFDNPIDAIDWLLG